MSITTNSPIGKITFHIENNLLTLVRFAAANTTLTQNIDPNYSNLIQQLNDYFTGQRQTFTIDFSLNGTPFQKKVWHALNEIPYGTTKTYGELAQELKTSPRAIGNACRHNPIPIIIPCHRIVSKENIGGFSGATSGNLISMKKWLLDHEQQTSSIARHR